MDLLGDHNQDRLPVNASDERPANSNRMIMSSAVIEIQLQSDTDWILDDFSIRSSGSGSDTVLS